MKILKKAEGFTLIELLVVVAIIGILAAIAIPQFSEYRARGFDARMEGDARNAATGQEADFVDNDAYADSCDVLPGFVSSDDVTCTASADNTDGSENFTVTTTCPKASENHKTCTWDSDGEPNLSCGAAAAA